MNIKITNKDGITLKTKDTYIREDISVAVDESILGVTPTGTYEVTDNGEYDITNYAKVNVNVVGSGGGESTLKKLLDYTKSCQNLFYNNSTITDLTGYLSYSDTENVTNMESMFTYCTSLTKIPLLDTSKVTTMRYMLNGCTALISIPQLNISNVTVTYSMFYNCKSLIKTPLLDTSKVTDMQNMFNGCNALISIDISYYRLSSTTYSSKWCNNCNSLKAIIIRSFGTKYTINSNAFNNCYHLTGTTDTTYNPTGAKDGYIYVPKNMVDTLKSETTWSAYGDQIRALEDYTVDGTTTGQLDESKVNA